ncbi:MAG: MmpS family transport accessory protein [Mycobacterium sp.]
MNRPSSPWLTEPIANRHDRSVEADDEYAELEDFGDFDDYGDYDGYTGYQDEPDDRRWLWVAGVAGAILFAAVVGTVMILSGGDSGTTSATVSPSTGRAAVPTPSAPPSPSATRSPAPATPTLPPETVTTVSPTAAPSPTPTETAPPPVDPRTVTYRITGNRQLLDLVTIIYTDAQGALQTDVNVALPWAKTVVLNPGVELSSVTATSVAGQLNCSITDASGDTLAAQNTNSLIATCTR